MELNPAFRLFDEFANGGFARIEEACRTNEPENGYLDFKQNRNREEAKPVLTDDGRAILGKAISAFANTTGGVIVWGVESKDKKANAPDPIPDIDLFVQSLNTHESGACEPPVAGVRHLAIHDPNREGWGYAVTYVPDSPSKPHQCAVSNKLRIYYMRIGSNFEPMPHTYVRALMLARARPSLKLRAEVGQISASRANAHNPHGYALTVAVFKAQIHVHVKNDGVVLADSCALALELVKNMDWPTVGQRIVMQGDAGPFGANMAKADFPEPLYPGMEFQIVSFAYSYSDTQNIYGRGCARDPLEVRYALFARDFVSVDVLRIPQDMLPIV